MADPYFSVEEARKKKPLDDTERFSDEDITTARDAAEEALEHACEVAFVPREASERLDGVGREDLLVAHPKLIEIVSASIAGEAVDVDELVAYADGRVHRPAGWGRGRGTVQIAYRHGFATVPRRIRDAALELVKRALVESKIDSRATEIRTEAGVLRLAIDGLLFDIPEVNAAVRDYSFPRPA